MTTNDFKLYIKPSPDNGSQAKDETDHGNLEHVVSGVLLDVYMTKRVKKQFDKLDARDRARAERWMRYFSNELNQNLIETQCRSEGRFRTGGATGKQVQIFAFKSRQVRVYGGQIPNTRRFVCSEIEPAKKQGSADQEKLKRAAINLGMLESQQ